MAKRIKGAMKRAKLPKTDSIQELADFWDTHDLTDFESELEEVSNPVVAQTKGSPLSVDLPPRDVLHVKRIAKSKGVSEARVLREWILERLHQRAARS